MAMAVLTNIERRTRIGETWPLWARPALARRHDPETSQISSYEVQASGALGRQARTVLGALRAYPGATSRELSQVAGIDRYASSRRLPLLVDLGYVRRGDRRRCRVSGKLSQTWWPLATGPEAPR